MIKLTMEDMKRLNAFCARVQDADYILVEQDHIGSIRYKAVFENFQYNPYKNEYRVGYIRENQRGLIKLLNEMNEEDNEPT